MHMQIPHNKPDPDQFPLLLWVLIDSRVHVGFSWSYLANIRCLIFMFIRPLLKVFQMDVLSQPQKFQREFSSFLIHMYWGVWNVASLLLLCLTDWLWPMRGRRWFTLGDCGVVRVPHKYAKLHDESANLSEHLAFLFGSWTVCLVEELDNGRNGGSVVQRYFFMLPLGFFLLYASLFLGPLRLRLFQDGWSVVCRFWSCWGCYYLTSSRSSPAPYIDVAVGYGIICQQADVSLWSGGTRCPRRTVENGTSK